MYSKTKVAILYIATGRYITFWDFFYKSAEQNLLLNSSKHYFVFTDCKELLESDIEKNITYIKQQKLGWPYDTLMRFNIFLTQKDQLKKFDYIFFFNANTEIIKNIKEEDLLPLHSDENLVLTHQPHVFHKNKKQFTYDRNPLSNAYIPLSQGRYYFTGALNGGKSVNFLEMCEHLNRNTKEDLDQNIIALWHDESHLNKYVLDRTDVKILPPYFTRGEKEYWKKESKVMFSDKSHYRFGGHAFLRGETDQYIDRIEWKTLNGKPKKRISFRLKQYIKSFFI